MQDQAPAPPGGRNSGIGASEIGAICGLNPFRAPIDVWLEKTGKAEPQPETLPMTLGKRMEEPIAQLYAEARGVQLMRSPTLVHPLHSWAFASPDRIAPDRLVECKNVGSRMAHHWPEGLAPDYVIAQVTWQCMIAAPKLADIVALIGGQRLEIVSVPYDADLAEALLEAADKFWHKHVLADIPPPVDASESSRAYLLKRFPRHLGPMLEAPADADRWAKQLARARVIIEEGELAEAEAKNKLMELIGDAEGLRGNWWSCTWKAPKSGAVSYKAICEELGASPELIARHTGEPTRRFLFKSQGE